MNHPKDEIKTLCQSCLADLVIAMEDLEKDNCVVCPECLKVNVFDVEKFKTRRQAIMEKMFGNRPENPGNN